MTAETRNVLDEQGRITAGFTHDYESSDDPYHPGKFRPFMMSGYWIPCSEGKLFTLHKGHCSITRTIDGQDEILYLVHPKSATLFAPLMEKYQYSEVTVPAVALSSFRTLLIAMPSDRETEFAMVKVSLNEKIGDVLRLLYQKECAASVATSAVLKNKRMEHFTCLEENMSFVPDASLIAFGNAPGSERARLSDAGMIHRPIPQILTTPDSHIIPLYALFGVKNWPLLNILIEQSKKSPTQFITDALLKPIVSEMVDHIFIQRYYLEFHGQNVLLKLSVNKNHLPDIEFIYRDMGGVNCRLSETELQQIPENLCDHAQYWEQNFIDDAAVIMEGIAKKVLFNLTKVFFKFEPTDRDPEFCHWRTEMTTRGYQYNWMMPGAENSDEHRRDHTNESFYRYGYFEKIFGHHMLEAMSQKGIFLGVTRYCPEKNYLFFEREIGSVASYDKPCINTE